MTRARPIGIQGIGSSEVDRHSQLDPIAFDERCIPWIVIALDFGGSSLVIIMDLCTNFLSLLPPLFTTRVVLKCYLTQMYYRIIVV